MSGFISCSPHRSHEIGDLFGELLAMSSNGLDEVRAGISARGLYFFYDHERRGYVWSPR